MSEESMVEISVPVFLFIKKILFVFGCAGSLLLCRLFSSFSEWRLLCAVVHRLLIAVGSLIAEHQL